MNELAAACLYVLSKFVLPGLSEFQNEGTVPVEDCLADGDIL